MTLRRKTLARRHFLFLGMAIPLPFLVSCGDDDSPASSTADEETPSTDGQATQATATRTTAAGSGSTATLAPTPQCVDDDDDEPTIAQTEGPYFTPGSPERASLLESGISGTKLVLAGTVLSTGCQPVARVLLDFWHCDDDGEYDNSGFRLRGHQFTDANGRYRLETILPGVYTGRTRHIHLKVQAPNKPVLTTQLYFPDEAGNARDGIFNAALVIDMRDVAGGKEGSFDFVLDL